MTAPLDSKQHDTLSLSPSEALRREVLHMMVELDMAGPRHTVIGPLSQLLSSFMDQTVSRNSLSMALSGSRRSSRYMQYLSRIRDYLKHRQSMTFVSNNTTTNQKQDERQEV